MKQVIINLPYNEKWFYLQIVKFFNFTMNLSEQEQKVLAKLIEYNITYNALDALKRAKFILSTNIKKEICEDLGIKLTGFNQVIIRLKKRKIFNKPILDENNILNELLIIQSSEKGVTLNINFIKSNKPKTIITETEIKSEIVKEEEINDEDIEIKLVTNDTKRRN